MPKDDLLDFARHLGRQADDADSEAFDALLGQLSMEQGIVVLAHIAMTFDEATMIEFMRGVLGLMAQAHRDA
jgi:hypothetical protein